MTSSFDRVSVEASQAHSEDGYDADGEQKLVRRRSYYSVILLTLMAAILQLAFLGSKSLWYDESMSEYRAGLPLGSLLDVVTHGQMNMSLYYLLLHGWTSIVGSSEFMLRLPSVLFAAATVPLVYALGAELIDRGTGLLAGLLVTVNATCIQYAQTARSYTMLMALSTLASLFFVRSLKRHRPASFIGYVVSVTTSVYAHLFGVFALPSQWLSLFLFRPGKKTVLVLTAGMFTAGIIVVPVFFFAISGDHGNDAWVQRTSLRSIDDLFLMLVGGFPGLTWIALSLIGLYLLGAGLALLWTRRSDRPALGFLLVSTCIPIGLTIAVSFLKPLFVARYLLGVLPPFALLAAIGLRRLRPAFILAMTFAIVTLALAEDYTYYRAPSAEDWRGAVGFVALHTQPGDRMLIFPPDFGEAIGYYVSRLPKPETFPTRVVQTQISGGVAENPEQLLADSDIGAGRRIWLAFPIWSPLHEMPLQLLLPKERAVDELRFAGLRVLLFERVPRDLLGPGSTEGKTVPEDPLSATTQRNPA